MTAPVFTPASNGRMTMEEYGEGCYVTAESILETRRALHVNPAGQLWERLAEHGMVHNHGPEEGRGLACAEHRLPDGRLKGWCLR